MKILELARHWWLIVLRGVIAILIGLMAFFWPGATLYALVILFGAFAFADGLLSLINAFRVRGKEERWWVLLLKGILGIAVGAITFFNPQLTGTALLAFLSAWFVLSGILEIILAIRIRKEIEGEWALILAGALSVLFGILVLIKPVAGAIAIAWWIGAYALMFGILLITLGLRLRKVAREWEERHQE